MRIDKLLANMNYGSRKEVKKLLKNGLVKVDGEILKDGKSHVDPETATITVGEEIVNYIKHIYVMMNKPNGVISATEDNHHKTVVDLLDEEVALHKPFPVGRLDKDTEGLLILTNDGQLSHRLLAPKKHVPKTYYAKIDGIVTEDDRSLFKKGVELDDGYVTKPAELIIHMSDTQSEIELTITEGKFHQVKRMFEAVDKKVTYLKRLQMGSLKLDPSLSQGQYRFLTTDEIKLLENDSPMP
ncbi:pseudouridine synthase [Bacillus sp. Marseille-Q3570]|uniref:pseudouridine synthase n=1 Tax=Bacillus sp. Marseille-Q3570 TaxID=2963522 RepID=UPI0021B71ACA|nr:pseudouridine synthase [Bacillus sp. Marseille-Q3570]